MRLNWSGIGALEGNNRRWERQGKQFQWKWNYQCEPTVTTSEVPSRKVHSGLFPHKRDENSERVTSQKQRLMQQVLGADAAKGGECVRQYQLMLTVGIFSSWSFAPSYEHSGRCLSGVSVHRVASAFIVRHTHKKKTKTTMT